MSRWIAILVAVLTLSTLSGVGAYQLVWPALDRGARQSQGKWEEIVWPYPRDAWPPGRAFRCATCSEAGEAVELYVRPKIGFCNCDTGVADDDEVDRVADLDLISLRFVPTADGKPVSLPELAGRARSYQLKMPDGTDHAAVGIALNHRCDLLVAVVQGRADASELRRVAMDYLASREIHHWMMASLNNH